MNNELSVIEQKEIAFYDDQLTAVRGDDGRVYASVRHMCDALGLNARGQSQRIDRHTVLARGKGVCKIHTPGGVQDVVVLRADLVPLWLSGVRTSMVKDDVRPKLERFQEEAAVVLWEAFQDGRLTADHSFDDLLLIHEDSPEVQAYKMFQGMMQLARNQIVMKNQLQDHEARLEGIEAQLGGPDHTVTPGEAMQVSQAVKAVALALGKQTKRNEFGAVYGELYRRYEITSYKLLPASRFEEAMSFLTEWHVELTGDAPF